MRSVGYADLFSLSRDDVLNAMKDYPEAEVCSFLCSRHETDSTTGSSRSSVIFEISAHKNMIYPTDGSLIFIIILPGRYSVLSDWLLVVQYGIGKLMV